MRVAKHRAPSTITPIHPPLEASRQVPPISPDAVYPAPSSIIPGLEHHREQGVPSGLGHMFLSLILVVAWDQSIDLPTRTDSVVRIEGPWPITRPVHLESSSPVSFTALEAIVAFNSILAALPSPLLLR